MKCIVVKPSHIQGFLCNFKIVGDISISFGKKWSWPPCMGETYFIKQDPKIISMFLNELLLLAISDCEMYVGG